MRMRFSYMSFTSIQRKTFKVIYSLNFCSLHIAHWNLFFFLSLHKRFCCLLSFEMVVVLLWLRFILDIVEQNGIARRKKKSDSKRLFTIDRYLFLLLTNSTRSIAYHDVIFELDCRFMDWSWRLLLSNILNDLCRDFYEAFAMNASRKKNEYWTNQENGTTPIE